MSITRASREYGEDVVVKKVSAKLCEYLDMVNLRSTMNAMQIAITAKLIVERHPHLPIKAIGVFFEDAMCGKFGSHYGRMDVSIIMQWLKQFEDDYFNMVEEQAYVEHTSTKGDNANFVDILNRHKEECSGGDKPVPMPDRMYAKIKEDTLRRDIIDRVHNSNRHLYSKMSVQEADETIDQLIKEELEKNGINN